MQGLWGRLRTVRVLVAHLWRFSIGDRIDACVEEVDHAGHDLLPLGGIGGLVGGDGILVGRTR